MAVVNAKIILKTQPTNFPPGAFVFGSLNVELGDKYSDSVTHAPFEVRFNGVEEGSYPITISALDEGGRLIGQPLTGTAHIYKHTQYPLPVGFDIVVE